MAFHPQGQQQRIPFSSSKASLSSLASIREKDGLPIRKDSRQQDAQAKRPLPKVKPGKLTELYGEPPAVVYRGAGSGSTSGGYLQREGLLGEGGFARVYACIDSNDNVRKALKVISKKQLETEKNKAKVFAEIKLHQAMAHGNIVRFEECFEDNENVYMVLELCPNGSLLELLKRRKRYTEPEARYYLVQLLCACEYMHSKSVIHRDLKLGNLFLDRRMNLKVGDFGLAALVQFPGQRKKTVCGTPNYIAPEILFDRDNGHSFEVDVWSIGVILYTFLVGKPPFQTKEVKEIYAKIKGGEYEYPQNVTISNEAVSLIDSILHPIPTERPSLHGILQHAFFHPSLPFPRSISTLSLDRAMDWSHITAHQSEQNLRACIQAAVVPQGHVAPAVEVAENRRPVKRKASRDAVYQDPVLPTADTVGPHVTEIPQAAIKQVAKAQETEVRHALAPDSPISELLNSARKPLVVSPAPNRRRDGDKGAQTARVPMAAVPYNPASEQPAASSPSLHASKRLSNYQPQKGSENVAVTTATHATRSDVAMGGKTASSPAKLRSINQHQEQLAQSTGRPGSGLFEDPLVRIMPASELYEVCWQTLAGGLGVRDQEAFEALTIPANQDTPSVFISVWVDYAHKYGMSYQLTDGSTGVLFNDTTNMILSPDQSRFDYISNKKGSSYNRRNHTATEPATGKDLKHKLDLLSHFRSYMAKQLVRQVAWTFEDLQRTRGMDFLVKYYRMRTAIIFRLSNDVLQFNFFGDHTKLLLSENGNVITYIGADYRLKTYTLAKLIHDAARLGLINPDMPSDQYDFSISPGSEHSDPRYGKKQVLLQSILQKLVYCADILRNLANRRQDVQEEEQ